MQGIVERLVVKSRVGGGGADALSGRRRGDGDMLLDLRVTGVS